MTLHYAKQVLKELKRIGTKDCLLIGGEPTLHLNLMEIISYGTSIGLQMKIVTNGRKMKNKKFLQEFKLNGIKHVSVSIEASTAEIHDKICGKGSFNDTLEGMKNCIDIGISLNSVSTISMSNKDDIVNIARMMHSLGVKSILFNYGVPPVVDTEKAVFMSPIELASSAILAYRKLKKEGIKVKFFGTIPICVYGENADDMIANGYISGRSSCHMFKGNGIAFEPSGNIIPCTHFVDTELLCSSSDGGRSFELGGKLDKVWNDSSGIRMKFQNSLWRYPSSECENCDHWGKCLGGCPLLWKQFDPINYTHANRVFN